MTEHSYSLTTQPAGPRTRLSALALACRLAPFALLLAPGAGFAQQTDDPLVLDPVDVTAERAAVPNVTERSDSYTIGATSTATRLDLAPRETPQTAITLTREQLEDFNLTNATSALQAAGVNVQRVETDRTYYSVRGFDVSNFQIDGIGLPFSSEEQLGDIDTFLYDHIEVLKGANGLTANPGNPAATVNFVRKRPTRDFQAEAALSYGSWDTVRGELDVSGPLDEAGRIRGRVLAVQQDGDSYLDRYSLEKTVFSAMLEADLNDRNTALFGYSEQRNRPNGIMWGALSVYDSEGDPIDYSRSKSFAPDWAYWDTKDKQAFAELTSWLGGGWQSRVSLNYREISSDAEQFLAYGVPDADTGAGLFTYASKYDRIERQLLGDAYLKGPFQLFGRTHEAVVGTNWSRSTTRWSSYDDAFNIPLPAGFDGDYPRPDFDNGLTSGADYTTYRRSVYGAGHFSVTDRLKLILGANHTRLDSSGYQTGDEHSYAESKTTPYAGVTYDFGGHYSAYASYTKIFSPQHLLGADLTLLDPIEGDSVEGGVKGEWFEGRLNASAGVFRTEQENTPEYGGFDSGAGVSYYNTVDAISKGYELTLAGQITDNWEASAGFTHLFSLEDKEGRTVRTYVPRNYVYVASTYQVPQVRGLEVGGSMIWQDDTSREQGATAAGETIVTRQDSYAVVNAMASYDIDEHFNVALNVNNLFDEEYYTSLYWEQTYYAAPRNATVTLTWAY